MPDSYYEIGTVGSTPIYEKVKARKRNLGKLYTQEELDKAVKDEREANLKELKPFEDQNLIIKACAEAIRKR